MLSIDLATYFSTDVPQTPIHLKPQLVRSASKTRGLRAPEVGESKKSDIQSGVIDFLDMTPSRPPQLAPVTKVRHDYSLQLEDVHANCFCASLLCTQIHRPCHALSTRAKY